MPRVLAVAMLACTCQPAFASISFDDRPTFADISPLPLTTPIITVSNDTVPTGSSFEETLENTFDPQVEPQNRIKVVERFDATNPADVLFEWEFDGTQGRTETFLTVASSRFDFTITEPMEYDFSGSVDFGSFGGSGNGFSLLSLTQGGDKLFEVSRNDDFSDTIISSPDPNQSFTIAINDLTSTGVGSSTGLLQPGSYRLQVAFGLDNGLESLTVGPLGSLDAEAAFRLTAVPGGPGPGVIPEAASSLTWLGLLGMAAMRRRSA